MPVPTCDICGKQMPPHIIEKHKVKSHSGGEQPKPKFDWESSRYCHMCQQEVPAILHDMHMHYKHGV